MAMHTIKCPTIGAALRVAIILEHEGHPSYWHLVDGVPTVVTMAPTHAVTAAIGVPNTWERA